MILTKRIDYMYNQRLEVYPSRYAVNSRYLKNITVTSGELIPPQVLPDESKVAGYESFPVYIRYRASHKLPRGLSLDTVTGTLSGRPLTDNETALLVIQFDVIGRDQGSLDKAGGKIAATYTLRLYPTLTYAGDIQLLTKGQQYEGGVPTVVGGAKPIRYSVKDPESLPPGLNVDTLLGRIFGTQHQGPGTDDCHARTRTHLVSSLFQFILGFLCWKN